MLKYAAKYAKYGILRAYLSTPFKVKSKMQLSCVNLRSIEHPSEKFRQNPVFWAQISYIVIEM